jgi:peptidoglycan hydrolase-like protein with peptidoglycan-binding domain
MGNFLLKTGLRVSLQAHDWPAFARGYNGPKFVINHYDRLLSGEFQKLITAGLPDMVVRAGQLYLTYLGFDPHGVDGIAGKHTLSALAEFQTRNRMPVSASLDEATVEKLEAALDNPAKPSVAVAAAV